MAKDMNDIVTTATDAAADAANDITESAVGRMERLRAEADKAIGKAKDAANAAYDKAASKARELADAAPDKAREVKERAQKVAEDGTAKVRTTVQEQPLAALGAGIALGFVVGWLLNGRKSD